MNSIYEFAALLGLAFGATALWKVSKIEKASKPHYQPAEKKEIARRTPKNPRLPIPRNITHDALAFFQFYDDAIDHLNKLHHHHSFTFDNVEELTAPEPGNRGSVPKRRIGIYHGNSRVGTIELKLMGLGEHPLWADLELGGARRFRGSELEWLPETVAWLVVDSEDDTEVVERNTLDSMARWAWQLGEDAQPWGTFAERYKGHGNRWREDWVGAQA